MLPVSKFLNLAVSSALSTISVNLQDAVREVIENALKGYGTSNYELELRTKTNEIRYLLINTTTRRDVENNIVGVISVVQDVTESSKNDRAIVTMANELRQLIETANAPVFGIDVNGNVNEWNLKTVEINGFAKEEQWTNLWSPTSLSPSA